MGLHMQRLLKTRHSKRILAIITALIMLMSIQAPASFAAENLNGASANEAEVQRDSGSSEAVSADSDSSAKAAEEKAKAEEKAAEEKAKAEAEAQKKTEEKASEEATKTQDSQKDEKTESDQKAETNDNNSGGSNEDNNIKVTFTLKGRSVEESESTLGDFENWILNKDITIKKDATVQDLIKQVLEDSDYQYKFNEQNELISITRPQQDGSLCIANGDLGEKSGWLFVIGQQLPQRDAKATVLEKGDVVTVYFAENMFLDMGMEEGTAQDENSSETTNESTETDSEELLSGVDLEVEEPADLDSEETGLEAQEIGSIDLKDIAKATAKEIGNALGNTQKSITTIGEGTKWSMDSIWVVLGLARSGELTDAQGKAYYDSIADKVEKTGRAQLSDKQSSDNSRAVLALTAAGLDPTNVSGYNLLEPLANMAFVRSQGMNGPIWALLAFDCKDYEIPKLDIGNPEMSAQLQTTRDGLIAAILATQRSDSGWAYSGSSSDVDMTCMAIQALAPYYKKDYKVTVNGQERSVKEAVDKALKWLQSAQNKDGSFSSINVVTSESASQVIVALTSLGIDPAKDKRFLKNGKGAVDSLLSFYVQGGGFKHIDTNYKANNLASMQGYYALVAYYRGKDGKNSLYDMTDAGDGYRIDIAYDEEEPAEPDQDQDGSADKDKDKNKDNKDKSSSDKAAGKTVAAAGTTKSLTKSAGLIKLSGKLTEKAKASVSLIEAVVKRDLPKKASQYSEEDVKAITEAYKAYLDLEPAEQLAVEKDKYWKPYSKITAKLGKFYHQDEDSGIDMRSNDEVALPWYIKLVVKDQPAASELEQKITDILGEGSALFDMYDIHFVNTLTGEEWKPEKIIAVQMPLPEELSDNPVVVHITDKDKIEFINGEVLKPNKEDAKASGAVKRIQFQAADFSAYGIAGMKGSIKELINTQEKEEKGLTLWICLGAGALIALCALIIARRKLTKEEN